MHCEHMIASMMEYLDGELHHPAARAVESHLAACPSCAARYRFERALRDRLQAVTPVSPPARLRRRLAAILRQA